MKTLRFLILFLLVANSSLPAQNERRTLHHPVSKFITLQGYNKWLKEVGYEYGYSPGNIKNRSNITFRLGDGTVGAVSYYPYLEYVCKEVAKNPAAKRELALEMAAWMRTEAIPPTVEDDTTTEIVTSSVVIAFLFPKLDDRFPNGALAAPLAERVEYAKKIERLCYEILVK